MESAASVDVLSDELFAALMSIPEFNNNNEVFDLDAFDADIFSSEIEPKCVNCGERNWNLDAASATLVCSNCGNCMDDITRAVAERRDFCNSHRSGAAANGTDVGELANFDPASEHNLRAKNTNRRNYIREKFRQWFMSETPIPGDDWRLIERSFCSYCINTIRIAALVPTGEELRKSGGKAIEGYPVLDKNDIQIILHDAETVAKSEGREGPFTSRYLEKWRTIRWRFCGLASTASEIPADLVNFLLDAFDQLDQAFAHAIDPMTQKKFPHYDTVIYRLLELKGRAELGGDLEKLRTRKGQKNFELCWWKMCKYLKWPYISRDEKILKWVLK